jgi:hypothetical protein
MSHPDVTEPPTTIPPSDPSQGLIECLADYLAPLFVADPDDQPAARLMAIRAMISYRPEMHADFIAVARSISFSMSALAALSRAATDEMPPALRLRYFGMASALSRSADESERTMERRRRRFMAQRLAGTSGVSGEIPEAGYAGGMPTGERASSDRGLDDVGILNLGREELEAGEATIEAAVAEAMLEYTSRRTGAPSIDASAASSRTADKSETAIAPQPAMPEGVVNPVSKDALVPQRCAKSELAAIISVSQRLGAIRQQEQGFERNLSAKREFGPGPTQGERFRSPNVREPAAVHPEDPV